MADKRIFTIIITFVLSVFFIQRLYAQGVELNGDVVEYSMDGNVITATGNVSLTNNETTLYCDYVEFSRDSKMAFAEGNVRLKTNQGEIVGDKLRFNFGNKTGSFNGANIISYPYFGAAQKVAKVGENEIRMEDGYITTSDFDDPEFRITAKSVEVFPGDKLIARHSVLKLGKVPLFYFPVFKQSLVDKKPKLIFKPGHSKDWGTFLLTDYRYRINEYLKGVLHFDYRRRLGFGGGIDAEYKTPKTGDGRIRLYYTGERDREQVVQRTIERYKAEWRHKWNIDQKTNLILQYYKLSDRNFLKDYFEKESDQDSTPDTYFLLTRILPKGVLSFRTDARVNRFESKVERIPEIRYSLASVELGETGVYYKNTTTYSNLNSKTGAPSEIRQKTNRVDIDNEVSYPTKVGIIEFKPFIGGRNTYYSRTKEPDKFDAIRGVFKTGASLSTKFYRIFDVQTKFIGLNIDRLRHIITPSIDYRYESAPTLSNVEIDQYDSVDALSKNHIIHFSFENKLQTKRDEKSVDLLRLIFGADFRLKDDPTGGGFDTLSSDLDFRPTDWLSFYFDTQYSSRQEHLTEANFDLYINGKDNKWRMGLGKRYNRDADDQITTEFDYKINQKWGFRSYGRFDIDAGIVKEQDYLISRDLHAWDMGFNVNSTRGEGTEFVLLFTLKAHPEIGFDFGKTIHERRRGSN